MLENTRTTRHNPGRTDTLGCQTNQEVQGLARKMVTDPIYLRNLVKRFRTGKAGMMEPLFWRYAFGSAQSSSTSDISLENLNDQELDLLEFLVKRANGTEKKRKKRRAN